MKKIILLVSDEKVDRAYNEVTSVLEHENIPYSASILDLTTKESEVAEQWNNGLMVIKYYTYYTMKKYINTHILYLT